MRIGLIITAALLGGITLIVGALVFAGYVIVNTI